MRSGTTKSTVCTSLPSPEPLLLSPRGIPLREAMIILRGAGYSVFCPNAFETLTSSGLQRTHRFSPHTGRKTETLGTTFGATRGRSVSRLRRPGEFQPNEACHVWRRCQPVLVLLVLSFDAASQGSHIRIITNKLCKNLSNRSFQLRAGAKLDESQAGPPLYALSTSSNRRKPPNVVKRRYQRSKP